MSSTGKRLLEVLGKAEIKPSIIEKISTPAEKKLTWAEYRKIFLTKERIDAGASFWLENREMLEAHREGNRCSDRNDRRHHRRRDLLRPDHRQGPRHRRACHTGI